MSDAVWAGVDIGGTKTAVLLASDPPAVLDRTEFPTLPAEGPERAIALIVRTLRELAGARSLRGIGVSCGGPLDSAAGVIQAPPNLWTWVDVPIKAVLEQEFGVTCGLENDANAGAVAEHRFGAGRGTRNMVFLTMGTGLGAGIIADGRLYRGTCDAAGEIGHVRLTRSGPMGYHKAGSVEGWASGGGLGRLATEVVKKQGSLGHQTSLAACLERNGTITARDVADAARQGDALAKKLIRDTGKRLGETLAILVDILNPERIVIGGLAMRLGDDLLKPARVVLAREALPGSAAVCQIVPAELDERIGDIAALCIAMGS
ncbi:MAG TPA: ROK family protein [Bryobacteraceae bacterium]|nr:ROK family protein [Bryobacteraceae bacterium]